MCIRVQRAPITAPLVPWDASRQIITIPLTLTGHRAVIAVRTVLAELGIPQDAHGARCWCGAPIPAAPLIPAQQRSEQVVSHGA